MGGQYLDYATESDVPPLCEHRDFQAAANPHDTDFAQQKVSSKWNINIVQELIKKGKSIEMLTSSGDRIECFVSLDAEFQTLSLQRVGRNANRSCIVLKQIDHIYVGEDIPKEIC